MNQNNSHIEQDSSYDEAISKFFAHDESMKNIYSVYSVDDQVFSEGRFTQFTEEVMGSQLLLFSTMRDRAYQANLRVYYFAEGVFRFQLKKTIEQELIELVLRQSLDLKKSAQLVIKYGWMDGTDHPILIVSIHLGLHEPTAGIVHSITHSTVNITLTAYASEEQNKQE